MTDISIVAIVACAGITVTHLLASRTQRGMQRVIDAQNDTIQRLINREPVTYEEVGKKPEKVIEEQYSAWGNVTVDREVENQ